jgi:very-short-patch-repair endonuclease
MDEYEPSEVPRPLAELIEAQHGVVTRRQLLEHGLGNGAIARRVGDRRLQRLHRGVFAVGHGVLVPAGHRLAAVLACGPGAVGSHGTAAAVHGLRPASARHHVTVPRSGPHSRGGLVVHRVRRLPAEDVTEMDGIRVTTVARTALDMAEILSPHGLSKFLERMELERVFDLTELHATMARNPGRRGLKPLAKALRRLADTPGGDDGALQREFLRLCRRIGLPEPEQQVVIGAYTVDFLWPDAGLVVETDGREYHATRAAFQRDRRRDIDLAALGLRVLRVDWWQVTEPAPMLVTALSQVVGFGRIQTGKPFFIPVLPP